MQLLVSEMPRQANNVVSDLVIFMFFMLFALSDFLATEDTKHALRGNARLFCKENYSPQ
jgi:hypothetical protein